MAKITKIAFGPFLILAASVLVDCLLMELHREQVQVKGLHMGEILGILEKLWFSSKRLLS